MAVFGGITQQQVVTGAQARLMALRLALEAANDYYLWLSAYALSDLQAAPLTFSAADGQAILNAMSDAHQLYLAATGSAITPALPYNFMASMRQIIGPQF